MLERCQARTRDGQPCSARPLPGERECAWHSATFADRRREWSAAGGKGKSNAARAKKALAGEGLSSAELIVALSVVFKAVIAERLPARVGSAAIAIAKGITDIRSSTEIEERVSELERLAAERRAG